MTFLEMQNAVYSDLGYPNPSTTEATRIKRWLNEGYRHIMAQPGREKMRDATITITSVAGQASYAMPMECVDIYRMFQVSNQQRVRHMTLDEYRSINPGLDQSSDFAYRYIPYGWAPVIRQPEGTGLWAVSTSASDTTQTFQVGGYLTNGDIATPVSSGGPLTGTARVQIGAATDWNLLSRLSMSGSAVGVVSVYDAASGGNELVRWQPGQTSAQYFHLILYPTPGSSGVEYKSDVRLALQDLVNDNDIPLLHPDFHDMLPLYARMRDHRRAGDLVRLRDDEREMKERSDALVKLLDWPLDYLPAMAAASGYGWNNLGGWYPADVIIGSGFRG